MRFVLDACVIYPTIMREILLGCASRGLYEPLWSPRIIEEWLRAVEKLGEGARTIAAAEAAVMADQFPKSCIDPNALVDIWLPDPNDVHVVAAAVTGGARGIITANTRDFPLRALGPLGLERWHPDNFLVTLSQDGSDVSDVANETLKKAEVISGRDLDIRKILKRAGLPRLGKLLG